MSLTRNRSTSTAVRSVINVVNFSGSQIEPVISLNIKSKSNSSIRSRTSLSKLIGQDVLVNGNRNHFPVTNRTHVLM